MGWLIVLWRRWCLMELGEQRRPSTAVHGPRSFLPSAMSPVAVMIEQSIKQRWLAASVDVAPAAAKVFFTVSPERQRAMRVETDLVQPPWHLVDRHNLSAAWFLSLAYARRGFFS